MTDKEPEIIAGELLTADPPKSGVFTSEFWLTVLPILGVMVLIGVGRLDVDDAVRLWPLFAGTGLYSVARGLAKVNR